MSDLDTHKLLSLDDVYARLGATEPMSAIRVSTEEKVLFKFDPDWALTIEETAADELVNATIEIDGLELQLTKEAALQAGAAFGLPGAYVKRAPAKFTEMQLNYWYGAGIGDRAFNLMAMADQGAAYAFSKPTVQPFSNVQLLESVEKAVRRFYEGPIWADYKFDHSLTETNLRLVFSDLLWVINTDVWAGGVAIRNSLIGKKQTSIEGYQMRWGNTTGAIVPLSPAGAWSRKSQGQHEDLVLEWAGEVVEDILNTESPEANLQWAFDRLAILTKLGITHNLGEILGEVFDLHKVPVTQRAEVIEELQYIEGDVTMYHVQQAISRTANAPGVAPARVDTLLRISGAVSAGVFDPVKAKVWREGNQAPKGAKSPYAIEEAV
jgi:hypothetical protein